MALLNYEIKYINYIHKEWSELNIDSCYYGPYIIVTIIWWTKPFSYLERESQPSTMVTQCMVKAFNLVFSLYLINLMLKFLNGVHLPLSAVSCCHLVLSPPSDVMAELYLIGAQPRSGQHLVERVNRGVDDVVHGEGELHLLGLELVPAPC